MSTHPVSDPFALPFDAETPDERRTRLRLRELCDEVIATRRVREGADVISAEEREAARATLRQIAPRIGRRERAR